MGASEIDAIGARGDTVGNGISDGQIPKHRRMLHFGQADANTGGSGDIGRMPRLTPSYGMSPGPIVK